MEVYVWIKRKVVIYLATLLFLKYGYPPDIVVPVKWAEYSIALPYVTYVCNI